MGIQIENTFKSIAIKLVYIPIFVGTCMYRYNIFVFVSLVVIYIKLVHVMIYYVLHLYRIRKDRHVHFERIDLQYIFFF